MKLEAARKTGSRGRSVVEGESVIGIIADLARDPLQRQSFGDSAFWPGFIVPELGPVDGLEWIAPKDMFDVGEEQLLMLLLMMDSEL